MTILLLSDWEKYPDAMIHYETKNQSFLAISAQYRNAGIKNHAFMLALLNPALRDVDPFDPTLTLEQQMMVVAEACDNFWYYVRECVRNPLPGPPDVIPIKANRSNIAMWWAFGMHLMVGLQQIRQTQKTFHVNVLLSWLVNSGMENSAIPLSVKDEMMGKIHIAGVRALLDELPRYMDMRTPAPITGDSPTELVVGILSNRIYILVPQVSVKRALNQGRGSTFQVLIADDLPYQYNAQHSFPTMVPGMIAAVAKAKEEKHPHGVIIPTVAGKRDTQEGEFVYQLFKSFAPWKDAFFDSVSIQQFERSVRSKSSRGHYAVWIEMGHADLGLSDDWVKQQLERTLMTGDDANREFFNMWTGKPVVVE